VFDLLDGLGLVGVEDESSAFGPASGCAR